MIRALILAAPLLTACNPFAAVPAPGVPSSTPSTSSATPSPAPANPSPALPSTLSTRTVEVHPLADLLERNLKPSRSVAVADPWDGFTLSADGARALLFPRARNGQGYLMPPASIVDLKTGARTTLLLNDPSPFFSFAGWLGDGRVLLVGSKIWIGAPDGGGLREVADATALAGIVPWIALPSPSGRYVALWGYTPAGDLGFVDLQTGATKRITGPFRRFAQDGQPSLAWSPDERYIAGSDASIEGTDAVRVLRVVDPFTDATVRSQPMSVVNLWWLGSNGLLAMLAVPITGAGQRSPAVLLDPALVERRRFMGNNWYPSRDGRYLLQVNPSQGFVETELFDLRGTTSVPLRFEGAPEGWTVNNELVIRR